ncbi:hypothetical protein ACFL08_01150 [Patescibacteria group bacterium]
MNLNPGTEKLISHYVCEGRIYEAHERAVKIGRILSPEEVGNALCCTSPSKMAQFCGDAHSLNYEVSPDEIENALKNVDPIESADVVIPLDVAQYYALQKKILEQAIDHFLDQDMSHNAEIYAKKLDELCRMNATVVWE